MSIKIRRLEGMSVGDSTKGGTVGTWEKRFLAMLLGLACLAAPASAADITIAWDPSPDPQEAALTYRVYARNVLLGETGGLMWTLAVTPGETLTIGVSTLSYYDADGDGLRETLGESTRRTITHTVARPPTEICGNGVDDDLDGQIDEDCASPPPQPPPPAAASHQVKFEALLTNISQVNTSPTRFAFSRRERQSAVAG